ncbi:MAG TPA: DUF6295 family protein [Acidimicrobiales bacterium]|nr:DUF6295 family protein [Acidimicrobiales bacterium]
MCTYITNTADMRGSGLANGEWFRLDQAVVYFDHPQDAPVDHALCIDFRPAGGPPDMRAAVELDAESARALARTILDLLDQDEVRVLTAPAG